VVSLSQTCPILPAPPTHQSLRIKQESTVFSNDLRPASEIGMQAGSLLKAAHQQHQRLAAARLTNAILEPPPSCRGDVVLFCCCSSCCPCSCSCCSRSSSCSFSYASTIRIPRLRQHCLSPGSVGVSGVSLEYSPESRHVYSSHIFISHIHLTYSSHIFISHIHLTYSSYIFILHIHLNPGNVGVNYP